MLWLVVALIAHGLNAVVFTLDKGLLGVKDSPVSEPARYAAYSAVIASFTAVVLPIDFAWPNFFMIKWGLLGGVFWLLALYCFFRALKQGESSRVVPLTGSAVPIFTLIIAMLFLGERLAGNQLVAVSFLVIGGAVLSLKFKETKGLPAATLLSAILAGAFFASHFAVADYVYDNFSPFFSAFAYLRMSVGVAGLVLLLLLLRRKKGDGQKVFPRSRVAGFSLVVGTIFIANKLLGSGALILQNYAISLGSVTLVNALQGTQYVFLLLLAAAVSVWAPKVFKEQLTQTALAQKIVGILLVGTGLVFLAL